MGASNDSRAKEGEVPPQRLDAILDPEEGAAPLEGAAKAAEINALKLRIQETLQQSMENRRTADGRLILSFESHQEILLEAARPW